MKTPTPNLTTATDADSGGVRVYRLTERMVQKIQKVCDVVVQ